MKLSVLMAAYHEETTLAECVQHVLDLQLSNIELELILVVSPSTDKTQIIAQQFANHPSVTLVLEEHALGKGFAIRTGLKLATGEIVLIQDADLEYSVDDYLKLITPIMQQKTQFVLGSRHNGLFKMRDMANQPLMSLYTNFGHLVLKKLFNLMYQTAIADPFTMYKVFNRALIQNVEFVSNRFDFDIELLAKLVRLGHIPIEIPITYKSRGYKEGKKIRILRDPPTWIYAMLRFRFTPLGSNMDFPHE